MPAEINRILAEPSLRLQRSGYEIPKSINEVYLRKRSIYEFAPGANPFYPSPAEIDRLSPTDTIIFYLDALDQRKARMPNTFHAIKAQIRAHEIMHLVFKGSCPVENSLQTKSRRVHEANAELIALGIAIKQYPEATTAIVLNSYKLSRQPYYSLIDDYFFVPLRSRIIMRELIESKLKKQSGYEIVGELPNYLEAVGTHPGTGEDFEIVQNGQRIKVRPKKPFPDSAIVSLLSHIEPDEAYAAALTALNGLYELEMRTCRAK